MKGKFRIFTRQNTVNDVPYEKELLVSRGSNRNSNSHSNLYFTDKNTYQVLQQYKNNKKESYLGMRRENI